MAMAERSDQRQQRRDLLQGDLLQGSLLQPDLWSTADGGGPAGALDPQGNTATASVAPPGAAPAAAEEAPVGRPSAAPDNAPPCSPGPSAAEGAGPAAALAETAGGAPAIAPLAGAAAAGRPESGITGEATMEQPDPGDDRTVAVAGQAEAEAAEHAGGVPERILILDTETTGLDPAEGVCIEVGAVLFHVGRRAVLQQLSFLLPCKSNPAEHVNGIPAEVTRLLQPWQAALACFQALVEAADAVVAHNAAFDRRWFGLGPLPTISRPWICSMEDIRWPAERNLRSTPSVRDLALAYGVPVWSAHRALSDCLYLVHVFERCADLEALLLAALEPRQLYRARLSYAERHQAREAGFRWNEPVAGAWSRRLSRREVAALPFPVVPVEAEAQADAVARAS